MLQYFHGDGLTGTKLLRGDYWGMFTAITPGAHYFGSLVVLLTTANPDGSTNITPISSAWSLGDHYVMGLGTANQGHANLMRSREVVLNLPEARLAGQIEQIAMTTGMDPLPPQKKRLYRYVPDKWALTGWTSLPSMEVSPLRIAECPVHIEATLENSLALDTDMEAVHVRVRKVHVREDLALDARHVDVGAWQPLFYTFRHYFGQGHHFGSNTRAEQRLPEPAGRPGQRPAAALTGY
ncbi:flavin reductase family protein [Arthrobacter sp. 135MFCol5.1]|uniref:flavin reductase family protein n=1 Tax=Arthrobacter sp. 135MFCol5.1 TaxID=1158050 RepID=UPI0018CAB647|nr:flavin reductase [Arthrobacter sp. 135MFCol5.1]